MVANEWALIKQMNSFKTVQQTAWREKQQLKMNSHNARSRNLNWSSRTWWWWCSGSLRGAPPPPFHLPKTQRDQWKSLQDQQGSEAQQGLQKYVQVQQRSLHTKHRIPKVIWLHGPTLVCKSSAMPDLKRDTDLWLCFLACTKQQSLFPRSICLLETTLLCRASYPRAR